MLALDPQREPHFLPKRDAIFTQITERAFAIGRQRVPVNVDAVDLLIPGVKPLPNRADHANVCAGTLQRETFMPTTAVKRYRKVLNQDEYASASERLACANSVHGGRG